MEWSVSKANTVTKKWWTRDMGDYTDQQWYADRTRCVSMSNADRGHSSETCRSQPIWLRPPSRTTCCTPRLCDWRASASTTSKLLLTTAWVTCHSPSSSNCTKEPANCTICNATRIISTYDMCTGKSVLAQTTLWKNSSVVLHDECTGATASTLEHWRAKATTIRGCHCQRQGLDTLRIKPTIYAFATIQNSWR